ncbi:MAG: DUF6364 family protein [Thermodesulfobacteriota bacterium]
MKQNITLRLEKNLIQQAKVLAAQRSVSVSRLLSDELARLILEADAFDRAKHIALEDLDKGFPMGGKPASREELHER